MDITREQIREYHEGTGGNNTDTAAWLRKNSTTGFDSSDDGTLLVCYFHTFVCIVTQCEIIMFDRLPFSFHQFTS